MKKRSKGVTILAVLLLIGGLMGIYRGYVNPDPTLKLPALYEAIGLLFSIVSIALAVGLIMLKEWARMGAIVVQIVGLAYSTAIMPVMEPILRQALESSNKDMAPDAITSILNLAKGFQFFGGVVFCAIIIFFLTRQKVKEQFNK